VRQSDIAQPKQAEWLGNTMLTTDKQKDNSVITTLALNAVDMFPRFCILDRIRDINIFLISVTSEG
jgi:hypothetical protein